MVICLAPALGASDTVSSSRANKNTDGIGDYLSKNCSLNSDGTLNMSKIMSYLAVTDAEIADSSPITLDVNGVTATVNVKNSAVDSLSSKAASGLVTKQVDDMVSRLDIKADLEAAVIVMSSIQPLIETLIGLLAYSIVIMMPLLTALDVAFIMAPMFREKVTDMRDNGTGSALGDRFMTSTNRNGQKRIRFISDAAMFAVTKGSEVGAMETGQSALKIYLGKRIIEFVLVAIVLYMLVGGQINVFTNLAIKLVSGAMELAAGLGR